VYFPLFIPLNFAQGKMLTIYSSVISFSKQACRSRLEPMEPFTHHNIGPDQFSEKANHSRVILPIPPAMKK
jgi:hypothetical protein